MFLFVQQWEILKGKEVEYTDFILKKCLPIMAELGLNVIGAFHMIIGSGPRISAVSLADDLSNLQKGIESAEFIEMTRALRAFVHRYSNAVLKSTGRVGVDGYGIELGTWRFNQYYDLIQGAEAEYTQFLQSEHIPIFARLGIRIKAEWQVVLGTGLRILLEGITASPVDTAKAMMSNDFRQLRHELLSNYVRNYSSRILAPTGMVEVTYMLGEMTRAL
ncbi:MAG: hypothetical protein A4E65_01307 [Syntrophorhabdus sp. PtaU1.Bin153]|nr:MAG: hypothetical protein A4E65_01307 [Syntrophorhabdus sp. PtaU1.Bin153]